MRGFQPRAVANGAPGITVSGSVVLVGQQSADGAERSRKHDESCGAESRVGGRETELLLQQSRQVDRESHEAAEGQEIEKGEHPREALPAYFDKQFECALSR